jgi:6-phosphogluconolactonase
MKNPVLLLPRRAAVAALAGALLASALPAVARAADDALLLYVGSYSPADKEGVTVFRFDPKTGALTRAGGAAGVENPSFLAFDPRGRFLFTANETYGPQGGSVSSFSLASPTAPALLNSQPSKGAGACYVAANRAGKGVLVANYGGGSVAALPYGADGKLAPATGFAQHVGGSGVVADRQKGPNAHSVTPDPTGRFAIACDLGADKLYVYRYDAATGTLTPAVPAFTATLPGAGPRHIAWHPNGKWAFVSDELSVGVTAYAWDAKKGALTPLGSVSVSPQVYSGPLQKPSEILVHPSGRFVYCANRIEGKEGYIVALAVDGKTGKVTPAGMYPSGGVNPRNFTLDPSGRWLIAAHQDSGSLVVFRVDPKTGALTPAGQTASVSKPVCVRFRPSPK